MKELIKVGSSWVGKNSGLKKKVLFLGETAVFFRTENGNEFTYNKGIFLSDHDELKEETIDDVKRQRDQALEDIKYLTEAIVDCRLAVIRGDEIRKKYLL